MKTNEKEQKQKGVNFTRGNSNAPLPGVRSADLHPTKSADKKGTSEDISELERKRVATEADKKQKNREEKK